MAFPTIVQAVTAVVGLALLTACADTPPPPPVEYSSPAPVYRPPPPAQPEPDQASSGQSFVWHPDDGSYPIIVGGDGGTAAIFVGGEIKEGDTQRLVLAIRDAAERYPHAIGAVLLNSPGGNALEAEKMAGLIHTTGIAVLVGPNGVCASACFLVFAAGEHKIISRSARIGVHSISDENGREDGSTLMLTTAMARDFQQLKVPAEIIGRMTTTTPDGIAWLTPEEEEAMGVRFVD